MRILMWLASVAGTISGSFRKPTKPVLSPEKWDEIWKKTK